VPRHYTGPLGLKPNEADAFVRRLRNAPTQRNPSS